MTPALDNKISVIVPIYNAAKFLDQCLASIEGQTHQNLEIICINDGSTDNSLEIIQAHAAHDTRYIVVDRPNAGYGSGCNKGIETATGEWLSVIEPDDWIDAGMYEDMLSHAIAVLAKSPLAPGQTLDIIKTPWTDVCDWDNPSKQYSHPSLMVGEIKTTDRVITLKDEPMLVGMHPSIWSAIYRTDFILEKGIKFKEYAGAGWADNPFLIDTMCQASGIIYFDKPYYNYRAELDATALNHTSAEAIARPFDRWIEMTKQLVALGVTDHNILTAHYLRGFNYIFEEIHADGKMNPVVEQKMREVFAAMDPEVVFSIEVLPPRRRKLFCEVRGIPEPKISPWPRVKYLLGRGVFMLRHTGFETFKKKFKYTFFTENKDLKG